MRGGEGTQHVVQTADGPMCTYRCPVHGVKHTVPYSGGFAERYAVASMERACLCPGKTPRFVRCAIPRSRVLAGLLLCIWVMNVCDYLFTRRAFDLGVATEANGVMSYFFHVGNLAAFTFKMAVVSAGVLLLWRLRQRPRVASVAAILATLFVATVVYQFLSVANA
jgi:hypothetical protein